MDWSWSPVIGPLAITGQFWSSSLTFCVFVLLAKTVLHYYRPYFLINGFAVDFADSYAESQSSASIGWTEIESHDL